METNLVQMNKFLVLQYQLVKLGLIENFNMLSNMLCIVMSPMKVIQGKNWFANRFELLGWTSNDEHKTIQYGHHTMVIHSL